MGGARAVEQLRLIAVELQMAPIRHGVHIGGADFFTVWKGEKALSELPHLDDQARLLLEDLAWWAHTLKSARGQTSEAAKAA